MTGRLLKTYPRCSSLHQRGLEVVIPPGCPVPPPDKPLPALPPPCHNLLERNPAVSSFNRRIIPSPRTPEMPVFPAESAYELAQGGQSNGYKGVKEKRSESIREEVSTLHMPYVSISPPKEILSPQPRYAQAKAARLMGLSPSPTSPTTASPLGHNSPQKIIQLTGLVVNVERTQPYFDGVTASPGSSISIYSQHSDAALLGPSGRGSNLEYDPEACLRAENPEIHGHSWGSRTSTTESRSARAGFLYSESDMSSGSLSPSCFQTRHHGSPCDEEWSACGTKLYHDVAIRMAEHDTGKSVAEPSRIVPPQTLPFATPSRPVSPTRPGSAVSVRSAMSAQPLFGGPRQSFSERFAQSPSRCRPPPRLDIKAKAQTRDHLPKTPRPDTPKSAFDVDHDYRNARVIGVIGRLRHGHDVEELVAPSVVPTTAVLPARSRKIDGPDTPYLPKSMLDMGRKTRARIDCLAAQVREVTGVKTRQEKSRDNLRNMIRVFSGAAEMPESSSSQWI